MARIRSIKPEIHMDEAIGVCSDSAYRLFTGLITLSDDYGRHKGDPRLLSSLIWPYQARPPEDINEYLTELEDAGLIVRYFHSGQPMVELTTWREYVGDRNRPAIPRAIRKAVLLRDGRVCQLCGGDILDSAEIHLDHVIPFSKGGPDTAENLQVTHAKCNLRKWAKV